MPIFSTNLLPTLEEKGRELLWLQIFKKNMFLPLPLPTSKTFPRFFYLFVCLFIHLALSWVNGSQIGLVESTDNLFIDFFTG